VRYTGRRAELAMRPGQLVSPGRLLPHKLLEHTALGSGGSATEVPSYASQAKRHRRGMGRYCEQWSRTRHERGKDSLASERATGDRAVHHLCVLWLPLRRNMLR